MFRKIYDSVHAHEIARVGQDVEKLEPSVLLVGTKNGMAAMENSWQFLKNLNVQLHTIQQFYASTK
jgi:hypothetical protein